MKYSLMGKMRLHLIESDLLYGGALYDRTLKIELSYSHTFVFIYSNNDC
jgi:hypothetical protein